jgi:hypothetical protein
MDEAGQPVGGEPVFEADAAIGKGWRTLDRKGKLTIAGGRLTLSKGNGDLVVEAPASDVHGEPARIAAGASARLSIGDVKYWVRPLTVRTFAVDRAVGSAMSVAGETLLGSATRLGADIAELKQGRSMVDALLEALRVERRRARG